MDNFANGDDTFTRFLHKRDSLNAKLDDSRAELDRFLAGSPLPPSMPMLATLEVLLKDRRDLLAELAALDDELVVYLVRLRSGIEVSSPGGSA